MNFTTFTGIASAVAVIWYGVLAHTARPEIFLDSHAIILVLGGTLAAALMAYPLKQYRELFSFLVMGALFPPKKSHSKTIEHLIALSARPDLAAFSAQEKDVHPYLLEGYVLMQKEQLTAEEFRMILASRHQRFKERYAWDAKVLNSLAKFPPAFGLLGATTGMIAMMSNLGASGKDSIGPSMAIALVATFWGIALANLVFLPLADHANRVNAEDARLRLMISTGLALIHQGTRPSVLLEHLLGFLPVAERNNPRFGQAVFLAQNPDSASKTGIRVLKAEGGAP